MYNVCLFVRLTNASSFILGNNKFDVIMSPGIPSENNKVTIIIEIEDIYGTITVFSIPIIEV